MDKQQIIDKTQAHIKQKFSGEGTGHDWWHIYRVWQMAKYIGEQEGGDLFIIQLGALLHDIADFKFNDGDDSLGSIKVSEWLNSAGADQATIEQVGHIVDNVSFKGAGVKSKMESLEGKVVQDADRLDSIGAIGIARAFAFGGSKQRPLHEPGIESAHHTTFEEDKKGSASTLNHFYEKLLHVKNLMNTKTGNKLAEQRHKYLEGYLARFLGEWEGKR